MRTKHIGWKAARAGDFGPNAPFNFKEPDNAPLACHLCGDVATRYVYVAKNERRGYCTFHKPEAFAAAEAKMRRADPRH